ncbi:MAG: SDR family oxidoreductase [Planctomycetaceae bacterium]|nr:SDR family oxidoreductase [Planctomycetaceae bacterium]
MIQFDDFQDRLAVVTGATQGIGRAVCRMLLDQGARVIGLARGESRFSGDDRYTHEMCDLSDAAAIESTFDRIAAEHGSLDYVVNVAGYDPKYSLEEGDADRWDDLVNLNLRGYYLVIRRAVPLLRRGRGRAIVNVSSINYRLGLLKRSIYSATKAGILGLTTGLARELGADGIRINTVTPGWIFTERQVEEYFTDEEDRKTHLATLHKVQAIDRQISPEDVACHILFYLSDASAASTGHNCVVDGGWILE